MATLTVRDFIFQVYRLVNASNPTVPLHGDDQKLALQVLNQLFEYYASDGQMLTIAKTLQIPINLGIKDIVFVDPGYLSTTSMHIVASITLNSPSFMVDNPALFFVGDTVTGTGIPAFTTIVSIIGFTVTLSANATVTQDVGLTVTHNALNPNAAYLRAGRLANLDSAWLELSGVTYPLIIKSRDEFLAAWKYEPLKGLPRFLITFPDTDLVTAQLYPAPSQFYTFFCRGKFQLPLLTSSGSMNLVPLYFQRFLLYATARDVCMFKGRADAWTEKLEMFYQESYDKMVAASEVNLSITGDEQSLLNGAWRVRAGI